MTAFTSEITGLGPWSWAMDNPLAESTFAVERAERFMRWYDEESPWHGLRDEAAYRAAWQHYEHLAGYTRLADWWRTPPEARHIQPARAHESAIPNAAPPVPSTTTAPARPVKTDRERVIRSLLAKQEQERRLRAFTTRMPITAAPPRAQRAA